MVRARSKSILSTKRKRSSNDIAGYSAKKLKTVNFAKLSLRAMPSTKKKRSEKNILETVVNKEAPIRENYSA